MTNKFPDRQSFFVYLLDTSEKLRNYFTSGQNIHLLDVKLSSYSHGPQAAITSSKVDALGCFLFPDLLDISRGFALFGRHHNSEARMAHRAIGSCRHPRTRTVARAITRVAKE